MVVESVGGTSLAHRARESILDSILERRFEDSRLPPENELAEMLGVSRHGQWHLVGTEK
jgi:DNA-binding FadR family transcriptional regulator